jgi:hypothetical protein
LEEEEAERGREAGRGGEREKERAKGGEISHFW